jgi:hypothetical protein
LRSWLENRPPGIRPNDTAGTPLSVANAVTSSTFPQHSTAQETRRQVDHFPEVEQIFHSLLAESPKARAAPPAKVVGLSLAEVFDKFLDWCRLHRAPGTYDFYHHPIQSFLDSLPNPHIAVAEMKSCHVIEWTDLHPDWSPMFKRQAMVAIQRPLNWADEVGHIAAIPIKQLKKQRNRRIFHGCAAKPSYGIYIRNAPGRPGREL